LVYASAFMLVTGSVLVDYETWGQPAKKPGIVEKTLLWLGSISYSLYLCHVPIQTLVHSRLGSPYSSPLSAVAMILLPIAVASVTYLLVESPLQKFVRRLADRKPGKLPGLNQVIRRPQMPQGNAD